MHIGSMTGSEGFFLYVQKMGLVWKRNEYRHAALYYNFSLELNYTLSDGVAKEDAMY